MDYKNGKIYQILHKVNDEVYVGSTTQSLCKRLSSHKLNSKVRDSNIYKLICEIGEDNIYIELIETYPCNSREELNAREGYYIRERGTQNQIIAGRTKQQWREENQEKIQTFNKQRYDNKKEHILKVQKQYYESNKEEIAEKYKSKSVCECGRNVRRYDLIRHLNTNIHKRLMNKQTDLRI